MAQDAATRQGPHAALIGFTAIPVALKQFRPTEAEMLQGNRAASG
jgi:hypothetical protein